MRSRKLPDGSFWLAQKQCRPRFADRVKVHGAVTVAYYRAVEAFCPMVAAREVFTERARRDLHAMVPNIGEFYPRGLYADIRTATPGQRDALDKLFIEIQRAIDSAYDAGVEQGKGLLVELAKGQLTVDQFNDYKKKPEEEG
jgi:hypothetical protein